MEYDGNINLTKGAIVCADKVSTVSPRYAEEIMNEYYSAGLHHILRMYSDKICGIINGIDTEYYDRRPIRILTPIIRRTNPRRRRMIGAPSKSFAI